MNLRPARLVTPDAGLKERLGRDRKELLARRHATGSASHEHQTTSVRTNDTYVRVLVDRDAPDRMRRLFKGIERFKGVAVYIHGSWADATRTPFSDLDDLVIVDLGGGMSRRDLWSLERVLNRIDLRFARLDPLQHHGHWIVESGDWHTPYDESFMPLVVLHGAMRLQGPTSIAYAVDNTATRRGLSRNIELSCQAIEELYSSYRSGSVNTYDAKRLIGSILLMPAYVFQSRGERVPKREAILRADEVYSDDARRAINWASAVRQEWELALRDRRFLLWRVLARLVWSPKLYRELISRYAPTFPWAEFDQLQQSALNSFVSESRGVIPSAK